MIKFRASKEQLCQIMANAVNASAPMGMGFLRYDKTKQYKPEDFEDNVASGNLELDYVDGRMVKLSIRSAEEDTYTLREPRPDYQSWCRKYHTVADLVTSAGAEVLDT
jgi:hypothetical protein